MERKSLEYYLGLKYPITLYQESECWVAEIKDLPGCMTQQDTLEEVLAGIQEARELWIEAAYEKNQDISTPSTEKQYSGKMLLRMPTSLHEELAEGADREDISINQYAVSLLSERNAYQKVVRLLNK